jgi:hypothetical protein
VLRLLPIRRVRVEGWGYGGTGTTCFAAPVKRFGDSPNGGVCFVVTPGTRHGHLTDWCANAARPQTRVAIEERARQRIRDQNLANRTAKRTNRDFILHLRRTAGLLLFHVITI